MKAAASKVKCSVAFLQTAKSFLDCKKCLDEFYESLDPEGRGHLESFEPIDEISLGDSDFDSSMRQMNVGKVSNEESVYVRTIQELYQAATEAQQKFRDFLSSAINSLEVQETLDLHFADLKDQPRAIQKAEDDYANRSPGPGLSWLHDVVRGMICCHDIETFVKVYHCLTDRVGVSNGCIRIVRLKNRFAKPTPGGFRDVCINIRIRIRDDVYHICELQIHLNIMYELGKLHKVHSYYEFFREYFRGNSATTSSRLELVKQLRPYLEQFNENSLDNMSKRVLETGNEEDMSNCVLLFQLLAQFNQAVKVQEIIVEKQVKKYGSEDSKTLAAVDLLGRLFQSSHRYNEAETYLERAVKGLTEKKGIFDLDTLSCNNNLGIVFNHLRQYDKAQECLEKVSEGFQKIGHQIKYMTSLTNLSLVLMDKGNLKEARTVLKKSLDEHESTLGLDHPRTLTVANNLGCLLKRLEEWETAESLLKRSLEGREKILGAANADTLTSVNNLGLLYNEMAKNYCCGHMSNKKSFYEAQAREIFEKSINATVKTLGQKNPITLDIFCSFGYVLKCQGDYQKAKEFYEKSLVGKEEIHREEHEDSLIVVTNLGLLLVEMGDLHGAKTYFERSLYGRERLLGSHHKQTISSRNCLAELLIKLGDTKSAKEIYEKSYRSIKNILGPDHNETLSVRKLVKEMDKRMKGEIKLLL